MANMSRRAFLALGAVSAVALSGCSNKEDKAIGETVAFEGLTIQVPDEWDSTEQGDMLYLSSDSGSLMISPLGEYSADEEAMASEIVLGTIDNDTIISTGDTEKGMLNGALCYSAPFVRSSNGQDWPGEVRAIFDGGKCWQVMYFEYEDDADIPASMVADTIEVA